MTDTRPKAVHWTGLGSSARPKAGHWSALGSSARPEAGHWIGLGSSARPKAGHWTGLGSSAWPKAMHWQGVLSQLVALPVPVMHCVHPGSSAFYRTPYRTPFARAVAGRTDLGAKNVV